MFDKSSIEENVDGLVRQIKLALMEDVDVTDVTLQEMPDSPEFSIEDLRGGCTPTQHCLIEAADESHVHVVRPCEYTVFAPSEARASIVLR